MKILLLPANNADNGHLKAITAIIKKYGDTHIRWSANLSLAGVDCIIMIPGEQNQDAMQNTWAAFEYETREKERTSYNDAEINLGRGLYTMLKTSYNYDKSIPVFLLMGPEEPGDWDDEGYMRGEDKISPCFLPVDFSECDLLENDTQEFWAYFDEDTLQGKRLKAYNELRQALSVKSPEQKERKQMPVLHSLLLLRRLK